jgi:hypothetical protein
MDAFTEVFSASFAELEIQYLSLTPSSECSQAQFTIHLNIWDFHWVERKMRSNHHLYYDFIKNTNTIFTTAFHCHE